MLIAFRGGAPHPKFIFVANAVHEVTSSTDLLEVTIFWKVKLAPRPTIFVTIYVIRSNSERANLAIIILPVDKDAVLLIARESFHGKIVSFGSWYFERPILIVFIVRPHVAIEFPVEDIA